MLTILRLTARRKVYRIAARISKDAEEHFGDTSKSEDT